MKKPNKLRRYARPEVALILLAFGFVIVGLIPSDSRYAIDIHLHDTYLVISRHHLYFMLSWPIAVVAFIYFVTRNFRQWKGLHYFHIVSILICCVDVLYPRQFFYASFNDHNSAMEKPALFVWAFLLGTLAFLVNLIAGFIRGKKSPEAVQ